MAYKTDTIETAKQFYVIEKREATDIANALQIPLKTVYNWIKKGNWDKLRPNSGTLSLAMDMEEAFTKKIREAIDNGTLTDAGTADSLWKTAKIIEKLKPQKMLLSNIFTFLQDMVDYFVTTTDDPDLLKLIQTHIGQFADYLRKKYAGGL